jgi:hypothetical protein
MTPRHRPLNQLHALSFFFFQTLNTLFFCPKHILESRDQYNFFLKKKNKIEYEKREIQKKIPTKKRNKQRDEHLNNGSKTM